MLHASATEVMGTRLDMVILGIDRAKGDLLWQQCRERLEQLEAVGSKFRADSETTAVNRAEPLSIVTVSPLFGQLLAEAISYRQPTRGCFDVTLGSCSVVEFHSPVELVVPASGLTIDLGGYLKGRAVDDMTAVLKSGGVTDAFIDFGGSSIMGIGSHPAGKGWPVSVTDPYSRRVLATFSLRDASLSTSGNTPAYNGHIVNPATGRIVSGNRLSAIVAREALVAEVLSTTWLVADEQLRREILPQFENVYNEFVYN